MRKELESLWQEACHLPSRDGARMIQFVGLREREGTSEIAAGFALLAAAHVRRTAWLVDLDFRRNPAFEGFQHKRFGKVGVPGKPYDATLGVRPVFDVSPEFREPERAAKLLTAHRAGKSRLLVTRFRSDKLKPGQRIRLNGSGEWWQRLRASTDWIIVDTPALERSRAGLVSVRHADAVVIVCHCDGGEARDIDRVRREVESAGGQVLGVVMNGAGHDARFLDRLLGG